MTNNVVDFYVDTMKTAVWDATEYNGLANLTGYWFNLIDDNVSPLIEKCETHSDVIDVVLDNELGLDMEVYGDTEKVLFDFYPLIVEASKMLPNGVSGDLATVVDKYVSLWWVLTNGEVWDAVRKAVVTAKIPPRYV